MEYGVLVNNKFDMFLDDCDDPIELLQRNEEEAAKQKKLEKANAAVKGAAGKGVAGKTAGTKGTSSGSTTAAKTTKPGAVKSTVQSTTTSTAESKGRNVNQELSNKENVERPPRFAAKQNENVNRTRTTGEADESNRGPRRDNTTRINEFRERIGAGESRGEDNVRGRGGFRRGGRGGRGGFGAVGNSEGGFDRFGKREFDRHSGSDRGGMKAMDKREGGGAHNWGNIKDDIEAQKNVESTGEPTEKLETEQNGEVAAAVGEAETEAGMTAEDEEKAEEEKQMTLDEWKRLEEQKKMKASFNIRQPGEGCSDPKWKKMFQLKKKLDDEDEEEEEEEEEEDDSHGKHKNVVPINITFNDSGRRGGMTRGGRGGPRGGRGFGPRGGRGGGFGSGGTPGKPSTVEAPNVDNEADFPSLA